MLRKACSNMVGRAAGSVARAARKWKREGGGGSATEENEGKEDGTRPALRSAWTSFSSLPSVGSVVQDITFSWSRRPAAPGTQPPRLTPVEQERATTRATSATSSSFKPMACDHLPLRSRATGPVTNAGRSGRGATRTQRRSTTRSVWRGRTAAHIAARRPWVQHRVDDLQLGRTRRASARPAQRQTCDQAAPEGAAPVGSFVFHNASLRFVE